MGAVAVEDEFPPKLLDCPTFEAVHWPEVFVHAGDVLRFDYASRLHSADGTWEKYRHRFSTGVQAYLPADAEITTELADIGAMGSEKRIRAPFDPVHMGFAERLYFVSHDGRQVVLANAGLGVDETDAEESFRVAELPPSSFAWDPEMRRLLALSDDGDVRFVLMGGLLRLSDDAMIEG